MQLRTDREFINFSKVDPILSELANTGFVLIDGLKTIEDFATLSKKLGDVIQHRDSNHPSGIITLRPTAGVSRETFKGYTRKEQYLHTDGTMVTRPADIVALMCEKQSAQGGESIFLDAQILYEKLALEEPQLLAALFEEGAAMFGEKAEGIFYKPILKEVTDKFLTISFRYDKLVIFSEKIQKKLKQLLQFMDSGMLTVRLKPGQGYVINNHRYIHGRRKFYGDRVIHRAQIHARPGNQMPLGFSVE